MNSGLSHALESTMVASSVEPGRVRRMGRSITLHELQLHIFIKIGKMGRVKRRFACDLIDVAGNLISYRPIFTCRRKRQ